MPERRFPIQAEYALKSDSMPWSIGELFYAEYAKRYGHSQDIETMAQRQGFSWTELGMFAPALVATLLTRAEAAERRVRDLKAVLLKGTEHTSGLAGFAAGLMNGAGLDGKNHPRVLAALAWEESIRDLLADKALARDAGQEGGEGG